VNDSNWLWLVGIVVVGAAVLLLSGAGPEPPKPEVLPSVDTGTNVLLPYVDAGTNLVINECSSVRLTCEGYDPNGGRVTYHWTAAGGRGSFDNAHLLHPVYTAPAVCRGGENIILTLTVTNERGVSASDKMVVRVCDTICCPPLERCRPTPPVPCWVTSGPPCPPAVPPPCVPIPPTPPCTSFPPYCPPTPAPCAPTPPPCITPCPAKSVDEGGSIQLHGKVWDPDCNLASYRWTADKGKFDDPTSLHPIYYAPMTDRCGGEDALITLTAVDSCSMRGADQILLHINNVNHLPVADAGKDLVVNECASIQLTCAASDADCDMLTCYWTATCGRGSFSDPSALHPVYTAPSTDRCEGEDIVLTLTVRDACGASASDSMIVHVSNVTNSPPTVKADP